MRRLWIPLCLVFVAVAFVMTARSRGQDAVDLISAIDLPTGAVAGQWRKTSDGLTVAAQPGARMILPWRPTAEYDMDVSFTRRSGANSIALIFVAGGKQASFDIDGWGQNLAGIQNVGGKTIRENPTRVPNVRLTNGRRYAATLRVRRDHVQALLDGKELVTYRGDGSDLSILDLWRLPDASVLGVGAWDSATTFHSIRVRSVSSGRPDAAVSPAPTSATPGTSPPAPTSTSEGVLDTMRGADTIAALSDEFDNPATLANWRHVYQDERTGVNQLAKMDIGGTRPGWMVMIPHASTWYQDYRGVLVHKVVEGDFVVTTRVRATNRAGNGPPRSTFSLAGIMVRTPRDITPQTWQPGTENYVFLSLGAARDAGRYAFEVKTTTNSRSNLEIVDAPGAEAPIRVARIGEDFVMLRKADGGSWQVHRRYRRPDMPARLQVGLTVYTDYASASRLPAAQHNTQVIRSGNPDLIAAFDYVHFRRPQVPAAWRGRNLADPGSISDQELLRVLGGAAD